MRIEEYIQEYFRDRTSLYQQASPYFTKHALLFFAPTYQLSDHKQNIANSEAEKIINIKDSGGHVEVITSGNCNNWRLRYHLVSADNS
jgi:hypothetical protein